MNQIGFHDAFVMPDGTALPYRQWLPAGPPDVVVLALHGFNDSADAWELPAPVLAAHGMAVVAPDQRGFGSAPERGRWPGTARMTADAAEMARQLHRRYPQARLYLLGESMGGAVLMQLASEADAPPVAGYVLVAPAVWGRREMSPFLRASLWVMNGLMPGLSLSPGPIRVKASDNREALLRLSEDPRTLIRTRVAAVKGLVDLMSDALAAAGRMQVPVLFMYGAHDELVPAHAMRHAWQAARRSDGTVRLAFYPDGYHLLLRDLHRDAPTEDLLAFLAGSPGSLPSGAEQRAAAWLAGGARTRPAGR